MAKQHPDVLVLGGGVIGLTAAYFLARDGLRVQVLDKGDFGQESSWAGAGILPPGNPAAAQTPFDRLRACSTALFPTLTADLRERTRIDNGYLVCGGIELASDEEQTSEEEWHGMGVACEESTEEQLRALEPALVEGVGPGRHLPEMAQVRNPRHLKALVAGCRDLGVELTAGCPVFQLEHLGSRITAALTAVDRLVAGNYLLTAGAWSEALLAPLGWRPGVKPVRGQIALLRTPSPVLHKIILWGSKYLVPRPDGRVLVGSTEEDAGFAKETTARAISRLLRMAYHLAPPLTDAALERCWAGLRPGSPDGLPILGRLPGLDNLIVATGHFRAGIQLSTGTALVIKELLLGQPLIVPLEAFSIERFGKEGR